MTDEQALATIRRLICEVAPDVEGSRLADATRLRDDLDLDSMDFLGLVEALSREVGHDIPERDYAQLATVGGCVRYLSRTPCAR